MNGRFISFHVYPTNDDSHIFSINSEVPYCPDQVRNNSRVEARKLSAKQLRFGSCPQEDIAGVCTESKQ